eukprot:CAMPEP_0181168536 /NCGR_PEP_ID=MMETSP1096-20121128/329_1 /TAXON_ID=156174 ORGANISM="Chrysochromulina ericina, Strain CCMP281" /NCGR_SAMPLE_ID=MMETSP1096 /ASSEMBLY_ACC=CAM_ASM_000453 /LENGTH=92 /DNA_ID=CAMNT_0023255925 /DNA_START=327 /DNA_END=602 /DNA_ORIENTATION=+
MSRTSACQPLRVCVSVASSDLAAVQSAMSICFSDAHRRRRASTFSPAGLTAVGVWRLKQQPLRNRARRPSRGVELSGLGEYPGIGSGLEETS